MAETRFPVWANTFIPDIGNGDPNIIDPGEPKQESGFIVEKPLVQEMNWILRQLGRFAKANNSVAPQPTAYLSSPGEFIVVNNTAGAANMLLPADPLDGQWVKCCAATVSSINVVTVLGNGHDIMIATDASTTLDVDGGIFMFYYSEADSLWKITLIGVLGA